VLYINDIQEEDTAEAFLGHTMGERVQQNEAKPLYARATAIGWSVIADEPL
jgi:hypothetical protein